MKKRFTLILASMFLTLGAWAQVLNFTFTRDGANASVNEVEADDVTATITATSPNPQNGVTKTGVWNTGGTMGTATDVLCTSTNTSAATKDAPITYTLTISGLTANQAFNSVTFTSKAVRSSGEYHNGSTSNKHYCSFSLTTNNADTAIETIEQVSIMVNSSGGATKDVTFNTNDVTADADGKLVLTLKVWNHSDNTGCFYGLTQIKVANYSTLLENLISEAQSIYDAYEANKGTLGYYSTATIDALGAAIETAKAVTKAAETDITALQAAIDDLELVVPTPGKFYRFKHPTADAYMLSDETTVDENKRLAMGALESNEVSSIFYYGEDGTLLSYANGRYLSDAASNSSSDWTCLAVGTKGSAATFGAGSAVGRLGFYLASGRAYWSGHQTYVDAGGSFGSNEGYDWVIEEVTTLPVTIGTVGYATLHAPVALTVPAGVTAYTGALNDENDVLTLTAINTGATIPANTAVILEGAANTYDFAVTTDAAAIEGNDLVGTVETEVKSGTVYTLQSHNGGVAFKQYTGENLTGFKAYLILPEATQAAAIRITRGGDDETTGIENSQLTTQSSQLIYDLAGRRVEKMEKGIYIVNGKKVIK